MSPSYASMRPALRRAGFTSCAPFSARRKLASMRPALRRAGFPSRDYARAAYCEASMRPALRRAGFRLTGDILILNDLCFNEAGPGQGRIYAA